MTEKQKFRDTLYRIELLKRNRVQKFLIENGLTPGQGQARVLLYLLKNSKVTQKEIAEACMLDVTTTSRNIDKMEKAELIRRERDPMCRRAYRIELTEKGRKRAEKVSRDFCQLDDIMCGGMEDTEIRLLTEGLEKVKNNLEHEMKEER